MFALNVIGLGPGVWQAMLRPSEPWAYYDGVAMSFWAALSLLAIIGVFFPLRILPLLLLQLSYKAIWLLCVGLPLSQQGAMSDSLVELAKANGFGVVLLTLVIPWRYLTIRYFRTSESVAVSGA